MAGVYFADQEKIKNVLELKNLVLKNNIYTLCIKVFPIPINCCVTLDRSVNKDHILRWEKTNIQVICFHCIHFKKDSLCLRHLTFHFVKAFFPRRQFDHHVLSIHLLFLMQIVQALY